MVKIWLKTVSRRSVATFIDVRNEFEFPSDIGLPSPSPLNRPEDVLAVLITSLKPCNLLFFFFFKYDESGGGVEKIEK